MEERMRDLWNEPRVSSVAVRTNNTSQIIAHYPDTGQGEVHILHK